MPRLSSILRWIVLAGVVIGVGVGIAALRRRGHSGTSTAHLRDIGPRLTSNQTAQPLVIYGEGLERGMHLRLGAPFDRELLISVLDSYHAFLRLPADLDLPPSLAEAAVKVTLTDGRGRPASGTATLTIVNDMHFPDLISLAVSREGRMAFAVSTTTDTVYAIEWQSKKVTALRAGDGPSAIASWVDPAGREWMVLTHQFAPEILLLSVEGPGKDRQVLPAPAFATGIAVDSAKHVAYVAEHARNSVSALKLTEHAQPLWRSPVDPNPRAIAIAGSVLAVGSLQTGQVQLLEIGTGKLVRTVVPGPSTSIVGGHTEPYQKYIIGGKAPRDLAWSASLQVLLVSSIGPNIGPNPNRWEVSPSGGAGVVDVGAGKFVRHMSFGAGVSEGLALDDENGLLYAADVGIGQIYLLDAKKLSTSDEGARTALLQQIAIPPPSSFPTARNPADFGVSGRAGVELHSGPRALALTPDRKTLLALNRFTGTLAILDTRAAGNGQLVLKDQLPIVDTLTQRKRRLGQVLYFTDMGRSSMSCDACHLEGHTEGVFFEKTHPMRIYRSSTVRGTRETPPYFTPASTLTLAHTARIVGDRNRFFNPVLTASEVEALTSYMEGIVTLPNPFLTADGSLPETVELPDGAVGHPKRGLALFEGVAQCAPCHPSPLFTTDQTPSSRGRYQEVGTPSALPLRLSMQNLFNRGFAPPSLIGAWDIFPMLTSAAAGFEVRPDETLGVSTRFPLRAVLELPGKTHGNAAALTPEERNDLLAYVQSL